MNQDAHTQGGGKPPPIPASTAYDGNAASVLAGFIPGPWYAVIVGRDPGVFCGSAKVSENVSGIPNGQIIRHDTEAEAKATFDNAVAEGRAQRVIQISSRKEVYLSQIGTLPRLSRPDCPEDFSPGRWYAVTVGREPGVYHGIASILSNTVNIPGHVLAKFDSHREARQAFLKALYTGGVYEIEHMVHIEVLEPPLAVFN